MPIATGGKSSRRFSATSFAPKGGVVALILFASFVTALHAQTIQIMLVNGKTGRPVTDSSKLNVVVGHRGRLVIPTDKHGVALLRLTHNDREINVPECEGEDADYQRLANKKPKASKQEWAEFNKKYKGCTYFEIENPIARYADSITLNPAPVDNSWKVAHQNVAYVPCWVDSHTAYWTVMTDFSTEDILQHGIVTANVCGKATASPQPGELILFVRLPTNREAWREAWN